MDTQTRAVKELTREIAMNDMGLPTGIYRVDMLPFHDYDPANGTNGGTNGGASRVATVALLEHEESDENSPDLKNSLQTQDVQENVYRIAGFPAESLHHAFMPLQYEEGFPAFESGIPFWSRLDFEPIEAFQAFQAYLVMHQGRRHEGDPEDEYNGSDATGTRSIAALVTSLFPGNQVASQISIYTHYYHTYYWGLRAHSYDLFRVAEFRKRQELRSIETQGDHYYEAKKLRHKLVNYMNSEEDFWDLMTPAVAQKMFKDITQLERVSAGLPAGGPSNDKDGRPSQPFEVIFKQSAQSGRKEGRNTINEEGEVLDGALGDPEAIDMLQELIIKGL